jgi:alkylhydroperoxidase family enzyme
VDINSAVGRKAGVTDAKLQAVLCDSLNAFSEIERAVIELADALTSTPSNVSDELYAKLREHFSEEQLLELSAQIAFENYRARLNRLYNAESDGLYRSEAVAA